MLKVFSLPIAIVAFFVLFVGVAHAQEDVTPPHLADVALETAQVDTSNGPARITVTVHATDDLSGIGYMQISFKNPASGQRLELFDYAAHALRRGTVQDGDFVITKTLPQYSAYGEWEMYSVSLADGLLNYGGAWKGLTGDDTNWEPQYDSIRFHNGPSTTQLFLPAVSAF